MTGVTAFTLFDTPTSWADARTACLSRGLDLARIPSADVNAEVYALIKTASADVWLGGTDTEREGAWHWPSGEKFPPGKPPDLAYFNWAAGEPNNGGEFAASWDEGVWRTSEGRRSWGGGAAWGVGEVACRTKAKSLRSSSRPPRPATPSSQKTSSLRKAASVRWLL